VRRRAFEEYARGEGLRWCDDPSNRSLDFLRNRVRRELLPALRRADPTIDDALLDLGRRAATWRAELDTLIGEGLRVERIGDSTLTVRREELSGLGEDSLAVVWPALAHRVGLALDRRGTRRLTAFTTSGKDHGVIPLAGGWRVEAAAERFLLRRADVAATPVTLPDDGAVRWGSFRFQVELGAMGLAGGAGAPDVWRASLPVGSRASVRGWSAGDRLAPAGGQRHRRVKRYLSDAGVRGLDRAAWPVVVAGDDVVWIPGVRRSDAATERSGRPVRHYVCERIDR
jgi:tRNA(Ile)-lysidine synthase